VLQRSGLGRAVQQHLREVDGVHAVDEHLVGLGEHRDPPPFEALDEVDLPQRTVSVQGAGDDPRHQLEELVGRPGARQRGAAYVVAEVEVRVVHPDGVGQPTGDGRDPLAVAGNERDPVADQLDEARVVEPRVTGFEDLDRRVVSRRRR
jgi:hypothetical protein